MPDVTVDKGITIDLLDQQKPGTSATSDMPKVETRPDASPKPDKAEAAPAKDDEPEAPDAAAEEAESPDQSAGQDQPADAAAPPDAKKPARGVQKRIDELTRQREDERRERIAANQRVDRLLAALERATGQKGEAAVAAVDAVPADEPEPQRPDPTQFTDAEQYQAALDKHINERAAWIARREVKTMLETERKTQRERASQEARNKALESYQSRVQKAREKYPDYSEVAEAEDLPITRPMADAIVHSENGTDIAYHLGKHPDECARISKLPPAVQLMELGRIASALSAAPPPKPVSAAPKPITPISAGTATARSSDEESMEQYAARRAKQLAAERIPGGRR